MNVKWNILAKVGYKSGRDQSLFVQHIILYCHKKWHPHFLTYFPSFLLYLGDNIYYSLLERESWLFCFFFFNLFFTYISVSFCNIFLHYQTRTIVTYTVSYCFNWVNILTNVKLVTHAILGLDKPVRLSESHELEIIVLV